MSDDIYSLSVDMEDFVLNSQEDGCKDPSLTDVRHNYTKLYKNFHQKLFDSMVIEDLSVLSGSLTIPIRLYRNKKNLGEISPAMLFFHGGGWVFGSIESHDYIARKLAENFNMVVISVDYRLAPEDPFPAALNDTLVVWNYIQSKSHDLSIDSTSVVVCGDSAGANLAASLCLDLKNQEIGSPFPIAQLLFYPILSSRCDLPSYEEHRYAPLMTTETIEFCINSYVDSTVGELASPRAFPLYADDLSELPPACIVVAEIDPLRDDGICYASRLEHSGNSVYLKQGAGLLHGFLRGIGKYDSVDNVLDEVKVALRSIVQPNIIPDRDNFF